jgi:hypothetical protein
MKRGISKWHLSRITHGFAERKKSWWRMKHKISARVSTACNALLRRPERTRMSCSPGEISASLNAPQDRLGVSLEGQGFMNPEPETLLLGPRGAVVPGQRGAFRIKRNAKHVRARLLKEICNAGVV